VIRAAIAILAATLAASGASFDVATVKPSQTSKAGGEGTRWEHVTHTPLSLTIRNATLSDCLQWAYDVRAFQVSGPRWISDDRYDILAKTDTPSDVAGLRLNLQTLLADRFQLAFHRNARSLPVYVLAVRKDQPKLRESSSSTPQNLTVLNGSFVFQHVSMDQFAERLSDLAGVDRPVLNATGIPGFFDITLDSVAQAVRDGDTSLLFGSIERLGLRFESAKRPVEILVVDRVEKPRQD
jgi:uncharacterized protein (TIGR03435 family)